MHAEAPRFTTAVAVETYKLRRSLALQLAAVAPALIAVFVFFNLLRMDNGMPWLATLQSSAGVWAFFMLPMSITALTALVAQSEHGPRSWDHLLALPLPRWHLYAAKALCVTGLVAAMSMLLAALTPLAIAAAAVIKPAVAATGDPELGAYLALLARIFLSAWLLIAVQLWVALHYSSFVPGLAVGIAGTFFAVVATSATLGVILPWQIPVNQLASDPARAQLALAIGCIGGALAVIAMAWRLSRRDAIA